MENEVVSCNTVDFEARVISINGLIDESLTDTIIIPLLEMDRASSKEIRIYLSTDGGREDVALCLADVLERLQSPTKLILLGTVASAGMLIVMGAYPNDNVEVCAFPSTIGMIHHGSWFINCMEAERAEDWLSFIQGKKRDFIEDYMLSHSKMTDEDYCLLHRRDRWYTAEEMLAYGFVDTIL